MIFRRLLAASIGSVLMGSAVAEPTSLGFTGLVRTPDARMGEEGAVRFGVSHDDDHEGIWASIAATSWVELSLRHARLDQPFGGSDNYRAADLKLKLVREREHVPQLAIGHQDLFRGSQLSARYLVMSKQLGPLDLSVGYADGYVDGAFGGIRYRPFKDQQVGFLIDYQEIDDDPARERLAEQLRLGSGLAYGVEYRHRWFGTRLSWHQDQGVGLSAFVEVPLTRAARTPYDANVALTDTAPATSSVAEQLYAQGYTRVRVRQEDDHLQVSTEHPYRQDISQAAGRVARTLNAHAPDDAERFTIEFTQAGSAVVRYHIKDRHKLTRYFDGLIASQQLARHIDVEYPAAPATATQATPDAASDSDWQRSISPLYLRWNNAGGSQLEVMPVSAELHMHDPEQALRAELYASAAYRQQLGRGLQLDASARLTLWEDVSEAQQPSPSALPIVRSNIGAYKDDGALQIDSLLLSQYLHPAQRWYARVSAGIFEEMYAGVGGQLAYAPTNDRWGMDVRLDWVRQRDTDGGFGFNDDDYVTGLISLHYAIPVAPLDATVRLGRFLAEDVGARFELSRRFASGVEFGAWYTVTDADDEQTPGSADAPYHDRGLFARVPLGLLTGAQTRRHYPLTLRPWARDAGQMLAGPDDLYESVSAWSGGSGQTDWLRNFGQ